MPKLQFTAPQELADQVQREADSRTPRESISRVLLEIVAKSYAPKSRIATDPYKVKSRIATNPHKVKSRK